MINIQFGTGKKYRAGWINCDKDQGDIVCNMDKFPFPFPNDYADYILCEDTIEHLKYPNKVIDEFHRIIKKDGIIKITTMHFTNPHALFGEQHKITFPVCYFYQRKIEVLNKIIKSDCWLPYTNGWNYVKVNLRFPKGYLTPISLIFELLFSKKEYMQILYEQVFSCFYRAYGLEIYYQGKEKIQITKNKRMEE